MNVPPGISRDAAPTEPEVVHTHYGHDSTVNRANEAALSSDTEWLYNH